MGLCTFGWHLSYYRGWNQPCFWPSDFSNNIHLSQAVAWPRRWFLLTPDGFHLTWYFCSEIITLPVVNELNCHCPHFPTNYSELWTTLEWENFPCSSWYWKIYLPCGQPYIIWLIYRAITYGIRGDLFLRAFPQNDFFFFFEITWKMKMIDFPSIYFPSFNNNLKLPGGLLVCILIVHWLRNTPFQTHFS